MTKKAHDGVAHMPKLDSALNHNQNVLVDALMTPHPERMAEMICSTHKIISKIPAQNQEMQPTQARGHIVWNNAYTFQPHGPSYLDPVPDPGRGGGY